MGGQNTQSSALAATQELLNDVWTSVDGGASAPPAYPTHTCAHTTAAACGGVYGSAGHNARVNPPARDIGCLLCVVAVAVYAALAVTWTELPTPAWSKRAMFGLTAAGSSMWLFGGGMPATNDVWRSTDAGACEASSQQVGFGVAQASPRSCHSPLLLVQLSGRL